MGNFFSDLFKYTQTERSTPLENFSTELLKYILENNHDILKMFLPDNYNETELDLIDIHTQYYLQGHGIADLLITNNETLGVIIKNKIYADFQENQISRYKEYLSSNYEYNYVVALITLDYNFEKLECGEPDKKIYWSTLVDNLERIRKDKNDMIIHEVQVYKGEQYVL